MTAENKEWVRFSDTVYSWVKLGFKVQVSWRPDTWYDWDMSDSDRNLKDAGFQNIHKNYGVRFRIKPNDDEE